jgi:hypothetical protein
VKPEGPVTRRGDLAFAAVDHGVGAAFIRQHHYARGCSNTGRFFGAYRGETLVGVCQYLPPTKIAAQSVSERWQQVLSLTRMAVLDSEPTNSTSMLLGASMRWVSTLRLPDGSSWEWLVTYADEARGHTGAIYKATNWQYVGKTGPYPRWEDAEGRQVATKSGPKTRTVAQMRALGYVNKGTFFKEKFIRCLTPRNGMNISSGPAIMRASNAGPESENEMNFGQLLAAAKTTERNPRLNENTINEVSITGIHLLKARAGGKLFFIADLLIDKSVGKGPGTFEDEAKTPFAAGNAHTPGAQVSEATDLTTDWGPGLAQQFVLAGVGVDPKSISVEELSALIEKVPKHDKDLTPNGVNAARGLKLRIETVPYKKKDGKTRFVSKYTNVPQTPEEFAANRARLDAMGIK